MVSVSLDRVAPGAPHTARVTILCEDAPYPATHGGKLDLWNLIRGLHHQGLTIQLVCWFRQARIAAEVREELASVVADIVELRRRGGWWRLLYAKYPPRMLAFMPAEREREELKREVQAFAPDWLLFADWAVYLTARALSRELGRPLVYRSQNVEHRYYRELQGIARGVLKARLALNAVRLFSAERTIRRSVDVVADISPEDTTEWAALGAAGNALVVPPLWLDRLASGSAHDAQTVKDVDVLFVGNLRTPNNLEGLGWFVRDVLPALTARIPALRVVFAGSDPDGSGLDEWRRSGVHCVPNPPDVSIFYPRARVVINPLQRGSGVNLKMVEALASGRPVVATPAAVQGLPASVRSQFAVGATPQSFTAAVLEILSSEERVVDPVQRAAFVDACFGPGQLRPLIEALDRLRPAGV